MRASFVLCSEQSQDGLYPDLLKEAKQLVTHGHSEKDKNICIVLSKNI